MRIFFLIAAIALSSLYGCSDKPSEPATPKVREKHFNPWEDQMKAMDDAKNLEKQLQQEAEDVDKKVRDMGG
ncbi:hypothetical protein [Thiolapillus brandeum]|uniref:Uncharacterized protein n=1 Tax=Thiolapillus brandeum TaxID=1076588 RepID=A0A7U6JIN2_9GAMM|nr:hypothetical protein [Thiolapillus brandeum]BAO45052.1 hypothetical protein TBH_C2140 [Thiolapillus brandeum]